MSRPNGDDANPGTITAPFKYRATRAGRRSHGEREHDRRHPGLPSRRQLSGEQHDRVRRRVTPARTVTGSSMPRTRTRRRCSSGGVQVTGWTQHSGNIWKAPLDRANKLRALYVNDKRAFMASKTISSAGCYGTYNITAGQAAWAWESGSQCDGARYSLADFPAVARNHGRHRDRDGDDLDDGHRGSPPGDHEPTAPTAWRCSSSRARPSPRARSTATPRSAAATRS